jgi:hypothetical protein
MWSSQTNRKQPTALRPDHRGWYVLLGEKKKLSSSEIEPAQMVKSPCVLGAAHLTIFQHSIGANSLERHDCRRMQI